MYNAGMKSKRDLKKVAIALLLILLIVGVFFYSKRDDAASPLASSLTPLLPQESTTTETEALQGPLVKINSLYIPVELAQTDAEVKKGLSGKLSLDQNKGMFFLFSQAGIYRFWMPNMHFPIDIIWIDSNKRIIGIEQNVSNEFDPANPRFYVSPAPAQYVLEVNAGFSKRMGFEINDTVTFMDF